MAAQRPNFIPLPPALDSTSTPQDSPALPSPRLQHVAGEIAPAMSPLDVFAAQSRALSKQLDEQKRGGRRISRLPPLLVADGLARKPNYYRSASMERRAQSKERKASDSSPEEQLGNALDIEEPAFRPKSYYPRLSKIAHTPDGLNPHGRGLNDDGVFSTPAEYSTLAPANDYFGAARREPSPDRMSATTRPSFESTSHPSYKAKKSLDSLSQKGQLERGLSIESSSSRQSQFSTSLLPPNPHYARNAPSIRSVDSEDDNPGITPSSSYTQHRKLSESSGFSLPQSPLAAAAKHHARTPSQTSEFSVNGYRLSRPNFNFPRPLSRNSGLPGEMGSRTHSTDSHPRIYSEDDVQTPMSMENSGILPGAEDVIDGKPQLVPAAPSYIYSKYSLPRGRMLRRSEQEGDMNTMPDGELALQALEDDPNASLPTPPHSLEIDRQSRSSLDLAPAPPPPIPTSNVQSRHSLSSMNTSNSGSTIKGSQHTIVPPAADMTAEDHLNKGIECHERGSLNESTYHLRLAARQNNPTAMLLYALACRHGWGMRPNPTEGVNWLRKAMDCASIELANDDSESRDSQPKDFQGVKARKAQFALSVYELGVSHMNGWGIEQDKSLALRCFEIASSWGDADAMAETGFCYAQGVGCKKDLKKAAKYYRSAEAKGVSMVGNSW